MTRANVNFEGISQVLRRAAAEQRSQLHEHECYALLKHTGAEAAPVNRLILVGSRPTQAELEAIPGSKVVLKVVSPDITHKTEAGGVRIVRRELGAVEAAFELMLCEVPEVYAAFLETLRKEGVLDFQDVRERVLKAHQS